MTIEPRENLVLFGHEAAERLFATALAAGRMHHAWLLTGPFGVGKATLAWRIARRLLSPDHDPNDKATQVVRRIVAGSHADVLTVERAIDARTRKLKREVAVEQVRDIAGFLHLTPAEGGWRVVVVDGAEDMNRNAANALLKLLEEPPKRAILLLTSDSPGRLLPTIRSRCRRLRLEPLRDADMTAALAHVLPGEVGAAVQGMAEGSPGRAVALAAEGAVVLAELVRGVLDAPRLTVERRHAVADQAVRGDTGFEVFMGLLRAGVGDAVRQAARGGSAPGAGGLAGDLAERRPLAEWGEVWHALGRLQSETERFNLDKRSAVLAGLELIAGP